MGIRFLCPNGHKLNVKAFQAGRRGICPFCGARFQIPSESTLSVGQKSPDGELLANDPALDTLSPRSGSRFERDLEAQVGQIAAAAPQNPPSETRDVAAEVGPARSVTGSDRASQTQPGGQRLATTGTVPSQGPTAPMAASVAIPSPPVSPASTVADPLAEAPGAVWYVRPPSGGQFGPAQAAVMRNWVSEGRVSSETLVWREGWADWQEAGSVFPELRPASAVAQSPPVAGGSGTELPPYRTAPPRRKSGSNLALILVLVATVLLLLAVLIVILVQGNSQNKKAEPTSSVAVRSQWQPPRPLLAWVDSRLTH